MAKTPFTLKSGNKLSASTFKMMGSSSPMHQEETKENLSKEETKENLSKENQIILNNLTENKTKDPKENATTISNTYGGTWKQDPRTLTNSETNKQVIANQWKNKQGLTVLEAAQKKQLFNAANDQSHPMSITNQGSTKYYAWKKGLTIAPKRYHGAGGDIVDEEGNVISNIAKT